MAVPTTQTELHQRILDNLNQAVLLFHSDLTLAYMNPSAEMLFGASLRRLRGMPLGEIVESRDALLEQVREAIATNHPFSMHEQSLILLREKEIMADFTVNVVQSAFGAPEIIMEMVPIDRLLRIARDDAIVAQQDTVQDLIRGLAHEIKNPLGGLRGAAQLLERELKSEEQREYTQVIIDEADRLQKLVNRLLGPSGMPKSRDINIHEVIEYVCNIAFKNKPDMVFRRDYDISIPEFHGDQDLMIQAILNIVNNAVEAMHEKGAIEIRTRIVRNLTIGQKTYRLVIKVAITDNGPGIPPDLKDKIFFPMITSRAEGTGLGLSIAQRLVHQHSGLIECDSEPGKTMFSIYLPIENEQG